MNPANLTDDQKKVLRDAGLLPRSKPGGRKSKRLRRALLRTYGQVCWICRKGIDMTLAFPDPKCFSIDHIKPLSLGGGHGLENLRPSHSDCNARRGRQRKEAGG